MAHADTKWEMMWMMCDNLSW